MGKSEAVSNSCTALYMKSECVLKICNGFLNSDLWCDSGKGLWQFVVSQCFVQHWSYFVERLTKLPKCAIKNSDVMRKAISIKNDRIKLWLMRSNWNYFLTNCYIIHVLCVFTVQSHLCCKCNSSLSFAFLMPLNFPISLQGVD